MSAYDNDPRVRLTGSFLYSVDLTGQGDWGGEVSGDSQGWWAWLASSDSRRGPFDSADRAIRMMIGDPR